MGESFDDNTFRALPTLITVNHPIPFIEEWTNLHFLLLEHASILTIGFVA